MVGVKNQSVQCIKKIEWQKVLFSSSPKRSEFANLKRNWECNKVSLNVHRTRPFEFVASVMVPYLNYAGFEPEIFYSDYDDTLSFMSTNNNADIELFWLDYSRYSARMTNTEMLNWLTARVIELRGQTNAPFIILDWDCETARARDFNQKLCVALGLLDGAHYVSHSQIMSELGASYKDERAAKITGMDLSNSACIGLARLLGSFWLPSLLGSRIKAIVLDLDNTLYSGVLGEDGVRGVVLTKGHENLHLIAKDFRKRGVFLAVCSKNELKDVEKLFSEREDFPLKMADFSVTAVSWQEKSQSISDLVEKLRIGMDSVLFVDDNPGELIEVSGVLNGIHCLHASSDGDETVASLESYPGLFRPKVSIEDELRIGDLAKIEMREKLMVDNSNKNDYFKSLEVKLEFRLNPSEQIVRLSELSLKTNQFNTGLNRFLDAEVSAYLSDEERSVVSVHLKDCLSDSGVIGAIYFQRKGSTLSVDEIAVSCRALGRHVESLAIWEAVKTVAGADNITQIEFHFKEGPRNMPAKSWLDENVGPLKENFAGERLFIPWNSKMKKALTVDIPVEINWR